MENKSKDVSFKKIQDSVFSFAYTMAFRDATMRNAFQRRDGEDDDHFHKRKQNIQKKSMEIVRNYIDQIFAEKYPNSIETIITICDENNGFTFGNAQKLVNMTAKYMYISAYSGNGKRDLFRNCDCPMDSVMISVVKDKFPKTNFSSDFSWSKMIGRKDSIPPEYNTFQEMVSKIAENEGINPIEVDYIYWDS